MREEEYGDKVILALRQKCAEIQWESQSIGEGIRMGGRERAVHREWLFGGKCSLLLPDTFTDMDEIDAAARYRNGSRPQIIKAEQNGDGALTFSLLPREEREGKAGTAAMLEDIRGNMSKIWKQAVFYDRGEVQAGERKIPWMDLKTFCLNGALYSLIFLFDAGEDVAMGNFHCSFQRYDIWKPVILKLLTTLEVTTLEVEEKNHERLSD